MSDFDRVREMLDLTWETWDHSTWQGDLVGHVRHRLVWTSEHSTDYPLVIVEPEDGGALIGVHAFHRVLWDEVLKQDPQPGDAIGIRYVGRVTRPSAPDYERFKLAVLKQAERTDVPAGGVGVPEGSPPSAPGASPDGLLVGAAADEAAAGGNALDREALYAELVERATEQGYHPAAVLAASSGRNVKPDEAPGAPAAWIQIALDWLERERMRQAVKT